MNCSKDQGPKDYIKEKILINDSKIRAKKYVTK